MRKLSDRSKDIDFSDLSTPAQVPVERQLAVPGRSVPATAASSDEPRTAIGAISRSIGINQAMEAELRAAKVKLHDYEEGKVVVMLDPAKVKPGRYANRVAQSFSTPAFAELKAEIVAAGRNVQPIKVRPIKGTDDYEIIFGHRRHRACLEIGIPVAAIVDDLDDSAAFVEMERENRSREDLSSYEQGLMYKAALDAGLFPSMRALAGTLNCAVSVVTTAVQMASLPDYVLSAFPSPLDLQRRWVPAMINAIEKDAARVQKVAAEIKTMADRPAAKVVFEMLAGLVKPPKPGESTVQIKSGEKVLGYFDKDPKGAISIHFKAGSLTSLKERKLLEFLQKLG